MRFYKRLLTSIILIFLFLSSCSKSQQEIETIQQPSATDASYPSPITTELPTIGYPIGKQEPTLEITPTEPITSETTIPATNSLNLEMVNQFTLDQASRVKWCSDQTCLLVIGYDYFKVLSYPDFSEVFSFKPGENETFIDASLDGKTYAYSVNNQDLIIKNWESSSEKIIPTNTFFMGGEFSPDGSLIMLTSMDEWKAPIYNVDSGELVTTLTGFETAAPVYSVRFGLNNDFAAWISRATVQVSEIATNKIFPAIFHQDFILGFDINKEGSLLATSAAEAVGNEFLPTTFIYEIQTGQLIHKFTTEKAVYGMNFSPDGRILAISLGNSISFYDLNSGLITNQFISENEAISQILFSPDGTLLLSSDQGINLKFFKLN